MNNGRWLVEKHGEEMTAKRMEKLLRTIDKALNRLANRKAQFCVKLDKRIRTYLEKLAQIIRRKWRDGNHTKITEIDAEIKELIIKRETLLNKYPRLYLQCLARLDHDEQALRLRHDPDDGNQAHM